MAPALHKAAQYIKRLFIMWRVCSWTRLDGDFRRQQTALCQLALQSKYSSGSAIFVCDLLFVHLLVQVTKL